MGDGPGPEHAAEVKRSRVNEATRSPFRSLLRRARRQPIVIMPYRGYGTATGLALCGRVLRDEGFKPAADTDRRWRNLVSFFKRLESDEVPGARVRARHRGVEKTVVADDEGYFSVELAPRAALTRGAWHEVELELAGQPEIRASGEVLVPADAGFGVISDIDDTIVQSDVSRKLRMILTLALSNARTRKPFAGVGAFYRALAEHGNPVFYVSKSPWNLYVPLVEYMEVQGIPKGPLILRDFGLSRGKEHHKLKSIEAILATYPRLPFILIGDSGEHDPEIYSDIVRRHPKRIRVIYIRSVDPRPARIAAVAKLAGGIAKSGGQLVLAPDSEFAAAHAAGEGLIAPAALAAVRREKTAERTGPRTRPLPAAR